MAGPGALGEPGTLCHKVCVPRGGALVLGHGEQPGASGGDGEQDTA